mmetsp:Transcript_34416/g.86437  ORF Transcript_34416/g.86437 Transcript_34416/m.86437 type:complete len:655 (-) Transcript_34416:69-2033(-)
MSSRISLRMVEQSLLDRINENRRRDEAALAVLLCDAALAAPSSDSDHTGNKCSAANLSPRPSTANSCSAQHECSDGGPTASCTTPASGVLTHSLSPKNPCRVAHRNGRTQRSPQSRRARKTNHHHRHHPHHAMGQDPAVYGESARRHTTHFSSSTVSAVLADVNTALQQHQKHNEQQSENAQPDSCENPDDQRTGSNRTSSTEQSPPSSSASSGCSSSASSPRSVEESIPSGEVMAHHSSAKPLAVPSVSSASPASPASCMTTSSSIVSSSSSSSAAAATSSSIHVSVSSVPSSSTATKLVSPVSGGSSLCVSGSGTSGSGSGSGSLSVSPCSSTSKSKISPRTSPVGARRRQRPLTAFDAIQAPSISVRKYLSRLVRFSAATTETLAVALVYVERLCVRGVIVLTELNVHRLLITAATISAKFLNDSYYQNSYYARVGGLSCNELNRLELEFLFMIDFRLSLADGEYCDFVSSLFALPLLRRSVGQLPSSPSDRVPIADEQESTQQLLQQLCEQASGDYSDDDDSDYSDEEDDAAAGEGIVSAAGIPPSMSLCTATPSSQQQGALSATNPAGPPPPTATPPRHPQRRAKRRSRQPRQVHLAMRPSPLVVRLRAAGPSSHSGHRPISDTIIACRRSRGNSTVTAYPGVPRLDLP